MSRMLVNGLRWEAPEMSPYDLRHNATALEQLEMAYGGLLDTYIEICGVWSSVDPEGLGTLNMASVLKRFTRRFCLVNYLAVDGQPDYSKQRGHMFITPEDCEVYANDVPMGWQHPNHFVMACADKLRLDYMLRATPRN